MLKKILSLLVVFLGLTSYSLADSAQDMQYQAATANIDQQTHVLAAKAHNINPTVLKLALEAYYAAKQKGVSVTKPILSVIDYSLPCTAKRFWVFDLASGKVLFNSLVAHGQSSGGIYTTSFSNQAGSLESSMGLYLTENTYIGHRGYTLTIKGLDRGFNDQAESRRIVLHGAWYVSEELARTQGRIGRSWGCPAIEPNLAVPVINTIKNGSLLFAYYPNKNWLSKSAYLHYNA
jgi:hypothetical protein